MSADKPLSRKAIRAALETGAFNAEAGLARAMGRPAIDDRAEWDRRRLGRPPKPPTDKQRGVRLYLSAAERSAVDAARGTAPLSQWLREAALRAAKARR